MYGESLRESNESRAFVTKIVIVVIAMEINGNL